jgi:hypothetical protein
MLLQKIGSRHRTHQADSLCRVQSHGLSAHQGGGGKRIRATLSYGGLHGSQIVMWLALFHYGNINL